MRPAFRVIVNDKQDITAAIRERLIKLTISDEVALTSDTLKIELDDAGSQIKPPKKNVKLFVQLGYAETGLLAKGNFIVDTVTFSGPPEKLEICARGANFAKELRMPKNRSWHESYLFDIVKKIADEHNLIPQISPALTDVFINHEDQTNESDISFLTRVANDYDAVAKPSATHLMIVKKGESKTATGKHLPVINIDYSEVTKWNGDMPERDHYAAVIATWTDTQNAREIEEKAGDGVPAYRIRKQFANAIEAKKAVAATLQRLNRRNAKISLTMPGNPAVIAESPVMLSGFREDFNGKWTVKKAEHRVSASGYTLSIDCEPLNELETNKSEGATT
jgi:hypothetical protein